ncbi:MAG TPA: tetratricopeptide repeat protein, partial [Bacilli bacterium]
MHKLMVTLLKILIPLLIIYICFRYHFWIGVLSVVICIAYSFYKGRGGIYASLGNIQYAKGNVQKSMVWLNRAYHTPGCPAQYVNAYGYLLLKSGDVEQAEQIFFKLLNSNPSRAVEMSARLNMVLVIWKKGNTTEAIEKTREIYADYKNSLVYSVLGYFLILEGDLDKALAFNLEAYEYNNTNHVILDNLGQTYYLSG